MTQIVTPLKSIKACLVSRDIADFALLIEDMDAQWGDRWGELTPNEARIFLHQSDARDLDVLVITADEDDRDNLEQLENLMAQAALLKVPTLLVAEDLTATELYRLMRHGGSDYIGYPLAVGALSDCVEKLAKPNTKMLNATKAQDHSALGQVFAIQGVSGGTGSTTLAVNLAHELSQQATASVCLIDLDLQFGNVATQLDLKPNDDSLKLWSDLDGIDRDRLTNALINADENLSVLTAPSQIVPWDLFNRDGLYKLLQLAKSEFDFVIIDLPKSLQSWTEAVFDVATNIICPLHLDIRSAEAARRYCETILAEELPFQKLRFAINRAPSAHDISARAQINRLGTMLHSHIDILLPDGGQIVGQLADQGLCLAEADVQNPLRKSISTLAQSLLLPETPAQQAA